MKFRKNKKGFTIVELIIVIAVIGILTAVMVPTIVHLVNKANKASDEALVSNLNKAIQLRRAEPGAKAPSTMHETVEGLKPYGYNVDALVAKSEEDLVYNLKLDKFVLSDDESVSGHEKDFWRVQSRVEADQKYYANSEDEPANAKKFNIYAAEDFSFGDASAICVGFDAGSAEVSSVNYSSHDADEVVIRTNAMDCDLTIDAANSKVKHYGDVQSVKIKAVKSTSYHEYGSTPFISINTGRVILEDSSKVEALHVESSSAILAISSEEKLPDVTVEDGVSSFKVQTTADDTGVTTAESNVTVAAGVATLDQEITAMEDNTPAPAATEEAAKEEAVSNSELVFQVKGSWAEVAAEAKALMLDYVAKVYNRTDVMTEKRNYSLAEIYNLFPAVKNFYVEVGDIHINVDGFEINNVNLSSESTFGLSVGSSRRIQSNYYKIENGKLYLAAPVAAFELMTSGSLVINKTTVALGENPTNTLSVFSLKTSTGGIVYTPHSEDAYSYDIDRSQLGKVESFGSHNRYLHITLNEVTSETTGIYVTRSLFTHSDGSAHITYGTSTIDTTPDGRGVSSYVTADTNTINWKYSVWFTGINKACTFNFIF